MGMRILILILVLSMAGLSLRLSESLPKTVRTDEIGKDISIPFLVAINILGLQDLVVRWLWIRFDIDSLGAVRNYHRLLPYLDLMTRIKPTEFHAWGLKTFMRANRLRREGNLTQMHQTIQELAAAAAKYPEFWRGHYEVAWMHAIFLKDYESCLGPAQTAYSMDNNNETRELLNFCQVKSKEELNQKNPGVDMLFPISQPPTLTITGLEGLQ